MVLDKLHVVITDGFMQGLFERIIIRNFLPPYWVWLVKWHQAAIISLLVAQITAVVQWILSIHCIGIGGPNDSLSDNIPTGQVDIC